MKISKLIIATALLCIAICVQGQINIDYTKKLEKAFKEQQTVEQAIQDCVVLLKQSYQVKNKKTGNIYGRGGREDFGHIYSIGVKTDAGLVITEEALSPWLFDNAFKKVEQDYSPFISLTEVRDIEKDKNVSFSQCPLQMGRNQPIGIWIANLQATSENSMEINVEEGYKDGWLIWFMASKDLDTDPESEIMMQVNSLKHDVSSDATDIDIEAPTKGNSILGGVYVSPTYLGGGHVAYRLVGMAIKEDKQWKLRTPFAGFSYKKVSKTEPENDVTSETDEGGVSEEQDVELTLIDKDNKSKKSKKSNKKQK